MSQPEFLTLSISIGTKACNAKCPFCISKVTPANGVTLEEPQVLDYLRLEKAILFAQQSNCKTALITGKGEPTLYMDSVLLTANELRNHNVPLIELQTNGLIFGTTPQPKRDWLLREIKMAGINTIAISIVHFVDVMNASIYTPRWRYPSLIKTINDIHQAGISVRLACVGILDYIDNVKNLACLLDFAKEYKVEQVTWRPVVVHDDTQKHLLVNTTEFNAIMEFFNDSKNATKLHTLPHGATVYDYEGQNICLTNCLTRNPDDNTIRQLIYFPDNHLRYDWELEGAIIF